MKKKKKHYRSRNRAGRYCFLKRHSPKKKRESRGSKRFMSQMVCIKPRDTCLVRVRMTVTSLFPDFSPLITVYMCVCVCGGGGGKELYKSHDLYRAKGSRRSSDNEDDSHLSISGYYSHHNSMYVCVWREGGGANSFISHTV